MKKVSASTEKAGVKVSIVDDDDGIRSSLATLIRRASSLKLLGEYADAETALREIPERIPDVLLMDINLPGMNGVECVRQLKSALPHIQVLMLTVYEDNESLFKSLKAGASGYLLKRTASARLLEAIHEVNTGGSPMTVAASRTASSFEGNFGQSLDERITSSRVPTLPVASRRTRTLRTRAPPDREPVLVPVE